MDSWEYTFSNNVGNKYIVKIMKDGKRFLSSNMQDLLQSMNVGVWGIYLNRMGNFKNATSMNDLAIISRQILSFFTTHEDAILYYVCDDIADVPMNARKKAEGYTVQFYRNKLFSKLFMKLQGLLNVHIVDIPICIDACGNDMFIHIIARAIHEEIAIKMKEDVIDGFSK